MERFFSNDLKFFGIKKIIIEGRTKAKTQIKSNTCTLQDLCLHCFDTFIQANI